MGEDQQKAELIEPEEDIWTRTVVTVILAKQNEYDWAREKNRADDLVQAERVMVGAVVLASQGYDESIVGLLPGAELKTPNAKRLVHQLERALHILHPTHIQIGEKAGEATGTVVETVEPIELEWRYANTDDIRTIFTRGNFGQVLEYWKIQQSALKTLQNGWSELDGVQRDLGLKSISIGSGSPFIFAEKALHARLVAAQCEQLEAYARQNHEKFAYGEPQTEIEARNKALEKAARDVDYSIIVNRYDKQFDSTYREIETYTVDAETGIRFVTHRPFLRKGRNGTFQQHGIVGISGFGPNKEIYYLTPKYNAPEYFSAANEAEQIKNFKPFYFDYDKSPNSLGISAQKEIDIWRAYCRAGCDTAGTQKVYKRESDWRYSIETMYWGHQIPDVERYQQDEVEQRYRAFVRSLSTSPLGKVRMGIWKRQAEVSAEETIPITIATQQDFAQFDGIFQDVWLHAKGNAFAVQDDNAANYVEFLLPYSDESTYEPGNIRIRLSINRHKHTKEILLIDSQGPFGPETSRYLKLAWSGKLGSVERGRYTSTNDAYFLDKEEEEAIVHEDIAAAIVALQAIGVKK